MGHCGAACGRRNHTFGSSMCLGAEAIRDDSAAASMSQACWIPAVLLSATLASICVAKHSTRFTRSKGSIDNGQLLRATDPRDERFDQAL